MTFDGSWLPRHAQPGQPACIFQKTCLESKTCDNSSATAPVTQQEKMHAHSTTFTHASALFVALMFVCGTGFAADATLSPSTLQEFVDPEEQISGGSTMGAMYVSSQDIVNPSALYAHFSEPTSGAVKLSINSIDGRYSGEAEYDIPPDFTGWAKLDFTTSHEAFVKGYSANEMAGLLTNVEENTFYPLRWGAETETDTVRLYVNSERAKTFFYATREGSRKLTYCSSPSEKSGFKFNSICDVPAAQLKASNSIKIHRKFGIRNVDPIKVNVLISNSQSVASGGR